MRWNGAISLAALLSSFVNAVFVDDAYHVDYQEALLGLPQSSATVFHRPQSNSDASLLYTISDKAVLGAVNPKDGSLIWRQALAGSPVDHAGQAYFVTGAGDGKVTTGFQNTVTAWDASNGRLIWNYFLPEGSQVIGLEPVPEVGSTPNIDGQDVVLLTKGGKQGGYEVLRIAGDGSEVRWTHRDTSASSDSAVSLATSLDHVFYVTKSAGLLTGGKAKVAVLDIATGKETKDISVAADGDALGVNGQLTIGSGSSTPFLVSSEKPYKAVKVNVLGSSKVATLTLEDKGEEIEHITVHASASGGAPAHFLVHLRTASKQWAEVYHLNKKSGDATKAYSLPATEETSAFALSTAGSAVYVTRVSDTEVVVYSSESHGVLGRWPRKAIVEHNYLSRQPVHAVAEVVSRKGASVALRVAVTSPQGNWYLIRNGELLWVRPEMLAYATVAAWSDDVYTDPLVQEIQTEVASNPVSAYVHRLLRHAQELINLPQYLFELPQAMFSHSSDSASSSQKLVGSQSVIVATSQQQLVALDAISTGKVQWQSDISGVMQPGSTVRSLFPDEGRITIYVSDGSIVVANATTGAVIEHKKGTIAAAELIELPGQPAPTILKVNEDGVPQFSSDLSPSVPTEGNSVLTIGKKGEACGWTVGSQITKTWTLHPPAGAKFVSTTGRPLHDPVASIGKVLGDRSVLYKFVSPNLAVLTATSPSTLTLYLVDVVTGAILHTSAHEGVHTEAPVPVVLSENWFAYSFTSRSSDAVTNTEGLSTQLVISELYESAIPNDRNALAGKKGNYSSFSADGVTPPHVVSQSYTLAEPISSLTVTQTGQGITSRQLVAYLPNSHAVFAIPRHVLDARRPVGRDPTSVEMEEGLFRYQPVLEMDPKFFLSHARDVLGVKKLMSSPTLLESTSLVFCFGHDVFGTQVAPSMTYDVLGKNFKKIQLVLTVVALYIGVLAIRPFARRKVVERLWL